LAGGTRSKPEKVAALLERKAGRPTRLPTVRDVPEGTMSTPKKSRTSGTDVTEAVCEGVGVCEGVAVLDGVCVGLALSDGVVVEVGVGAACERRGSR